MRAIHPQDVAARTARITSRSSRVARHAVGWTAILAFGLLAAGGMVYAGTWVLVISLFVVLALSLVP